MFQTISFTFHFFWMSSTSTAMLYSWIGAMLDTCSYDFDPQGWTGPYRELVPVTFYHLKFQHYGIDTDMTGFVQGSTHLLLKLQKQTINSQILCLVTQGNSSCSELSVQALKEFWQASHTLIADLEGADVAWKSTVTHSWHRYELTELLP